MRRQAGEHAPQIVLVREPWHLLPFRRSGQRSHGFYRLEFLLGDDREEVAVADHLDHAGELFDGRDIALRQLRSIARRPHDPCMHHAGQTHVLDIRGASRDFGRDINPSHRLAHYLKCRRILQLRRRLRLHMQHVARDQIAIAEAPPVGRDHRAILGAQIFRW